LGGIPNINEGGSRGERRIRSKKGNLPTKIEEINEGEIFCKIISASQEEI